MKKTLFNLCISVLLITSCIWHRTVWMALVFLIFTSNTNAQDVTFKVKKPAKTNSILVYHQNPLGTDVKIAFRIIGKIVQIDTNYDEAADIFTIDGVENIKAKPLYSEIASLKPIDFANLQKYFKEIGGCDSIYPFIIRITENNKVETFSLAGYGKYCMVNYRKKTMDDLWDYFFPGK